MPRAGEKQRSPLLLWHEHCTHLLLERPQRQTPLPAMVVATGQTGLEGPLCGRPKRQHGWGSDRPESGSGLAMLTGRPAGRVAAMVDCVICRGAVRAGSLWCPRVLRAAGAMKRPLPRTALVVLLAALLLAAPATKGASTADFDLGEDDAEACRALPYRSKCAKLQLHAEEVQESLDALCNAGGWLSNPTGSCTDRTACPPALLGVEPGRVGTRAGGLRCSAWGDFLYMCSLTGSCMPALAAHLLQQHALPKAGGGCVRTTRLAFLPPPLSFMLLPH